MVQNKKITQEITEKERCKCNKNKTDHLIIPWACPYQRSNMSEHGKCG
jgi:hypothetical protein